jgi:hypothetical protein
MKTRSPFVKFLPASILVIILFSSCQAQPVQDIPTAIPTASPTATITPTPQPLQISITKLVQECEQLAAEKRTVIIEGAVMLPDETVSGYEIDGVRWLGMKLISSEQVRLLTRVGTEAATMNDLPALFSEKDLVIRASDGRSILDRHRVRISGTVKYRKDKPEKSCEVFADVIESLEDPAVLEPRDLSIEELLDNDEIDDCQLVEATNQLIRMRGWIIVNDDTTTCWNGRCRTPFSDGTGQLIVQLSNGGGSNSFGMLAAPYLQENARVFDQEGGLADPADVILIGQITGIASEYCLLTVYTILPSGSE